MDKTKGAVRLCTTLETLGDSKRSIISFYNEGLDAKNKGTNSSQWFIAYKAFPEYDYYDEEFYKRDCASPDINCYTPFGMIFEGLDTAKSIIEGDIIKSVTIEKLERGNSTLPPGNR